MKLRIKDGTRRWQLALPSGCTLAELKAHVAEALALPSDAFYLSLNRQDALEGPPDNPVAQLGVRNGDLLWLLTPAVPTCSVLPTSPGACVEEYPNQETTQQQQQQQREQRVRHEQLDAAAACAVQAPPQCGRLPLHLIRVLQQNDQLPWPAQLLLLAAHAAMLETGFLPSWAGFAPSLGDASSAHRLPLSCRHGSVHKIRYCLPPGRRGGDGMETMEGGSQLPDCTLQCSTVNGGTVLLAASSSSHVRHLVLRAADFLSAPGSGVAASDTPRDGSVRVASNGCAVLCGALQMTPAAVRDLWVALKDSLAFPLLLASHNEAGLAPPAGLLALPHDLKGSILRLLGPVDLASLCCVCSELGHLASQDDLWRPLLEREFPHHSARHVAPQAYPLGYKSAFECCWRQRRQHEEDVQRSRRRHSMPHFTSLRPPFYPSPHPGFPGMIGGEFDRLPQLGPGFGPPGPFAFRGSSVQQGRRRSSFRLH